MPQNARQKARYKWYVEPEDAATNNVISRLLPEENACPEAECNDGKKHSLWACTGWTLIGKLNASRVDLRLRYQIWVKKLPYGAIRPIRFGKKKILQRVAA
ncbi:MAG: hypothetical protein A3H57_03150 [Candidatus Taylorbacteria bacterium RIFCSPLOWO2_02_FULL_43_11]|uniref:Uncharacterized protein n=1 Tax=Candidatus Taylorbacteria bacterium RIFCSPHIGHO2_02_FULL_43_32b TaxID=1802306 RepID=A0A1G2MP41_9BACT|nr:MAG: hypothetical protein A2743_03245 [Candidatus Taylorbacteria bacterium RIFCSPHIGHO2_01_FULL_43_47]OHA24762.1 MAG: hypothetical protein A3C72_00810 [Candidatus Taylorbacteria bacterium RIFCSPHIGHO2_02_FULL_43_32b]OHA31688.1 MAG: hypothetical protein A3B08_00155 [Candidatus Taylorbacteria bacterium RIFCSPLOWO2_01_FULL_43_44]OHA35401.1 MAG: hypothetical protein A3H57_03150 [Candidatus Taylorbacteria bacterium RIFCSPLOWO2_02_FULL_43_11]